MNRDKALVIVLSLCLIFTASASAASDDLKMPKRRLKDSLQNQYMLTLIHQAMRATIPEYGQYSITQDVPPVLPGRAALALKEGRINIYIAPVLDELLHQVYVVPIPIRRGILSYRLPLIHKNNLAIFSKVTDYEDLKPLTFGMYKGTSTLPLFKRLDFPTITAPGPLEMLTMLEHQRFHYSVRGIHEIYFELENNREIMPNVVVEPTLALHIFLPTVIYLPPDNKRLIERVENGFLKIIEDGTFRKTFDHYYSRYAKRAKLHKRKVITITNAFSDHIDFPDIPGLWFDPKEVENLP